MRIAVIDKKKCNSESCGKVCYKYCPIVRSGKEIIIFNKEGKASINESLCIGCSICVKKCPFKAISIINLPEELKNGVIHQYGKNSFRLFKFPIPKKGSVVGILGQNGIGKTTALNILSGNLKPNLGDYEKEAENKEIIKFFKGTEAHEYFKKLLDKKIKISYKPQYVDLIPRKFKGKTIELLKKIEKNTDLILRKAKELEIENILNNDLNKLSGGELQRVAILATILKQADIYFFDEPASYLDVRQRIKIAKIIRDLINDNKYVLVVEHDLIMLDYLTDLLHINYGKPGAYGIVSQPINSRDGINAYIKGYILGENVRFRNYELKFEKHASLKIEENLKLFEWKDFEKEFNNFKLSVEGGSIYQREIIGVIGENATGKTTFAKILAGELKPSKGKISFKTKISYKPQYIKTESTETVMEHLQKITKEFGSEKYELEIINPLMLRELFNKKLCNLSGGELQRVAIAECLSKEASIYLLDEPSAHLDVEQRISIAKAIRNFVKKRESSVLIIDHDLMVLDYLSDRIMVFYGEAGRKSIAKEPTEARKGMNFLFKQLGITFRKDPVTNRPRANKLGSVKDKEQKMKGEYY